MVFYFTEYDNGVEVVCNYLKGIYAPETIEYICNQYSSLMDRIAASPEKVSAEYFETKKRIIRK
jgi:hypothetical protein